MLFSSTRILLAALLVVAGVTPAIAQAPPDDEQVRRLLEERQRLEKEIERLREEEKARAQMKAAHCQYLSQELQVEGVRRDSFERRAARNREIEAKMRELRC